MLSRHIYIFHKKIILILIFSVVMYFKIKKECLIYNMLSRWLS